MASRAGTGEVLHIRLRKGKANSSRGVLRFAEELIARVARAGAGGEKLLRADSAFWNKTLMKRLEQAGWLYSISISLRKGVAEQIASIPEADWTALADYPADGEAQIAETAYGERRMIVRRTRLVGPQAELWPDWRHFPFLTNRSEDIILVEAEHRQHAVVELTIRDLKDQALAHFPSGQFNANSAWTVIAAIAHNLTRWTTVIGLPSHTIRAARTLRRRLLQIPGRLTRTARQWTLHLPARRRRGRPTSSMRLPASGRFPRPPEQDPTPRRRYEHRAAPSRHRCAKTRPIALKAQRDPSHQQTRSQTSTAGTPDSTRTRRNQRPPSADRSR